MQRADYYVIITHLLYSFFLTRHIVVDVVVLIPLIRWHVCQTTWSNLVNCIKQTINFH